MKSEKVMMVDSQLPIKKRKIISKEFSFEPNKKEEKSSWGSLVFQGWGNSNVNRLKKIPNHEEFKIPKTSSIEYRSFPLFLEEPEFSYTNDFREIGGVPHHWVKPYVRSNGARVSGFWRKYH